MSGEVPKPLLLVLLSPYSIPLSSPSPKLLPWPLTHLCVLPQGIVYDLLAKDLESNETKRSAIIPWNR